MKILTTALLLISFTFLTACGGGGGGGGKSTSSSAIIKIEQTPLLFASAQQSLRLDQEVVYSLSGGSGSGAMAYLSSDTNVATIDSNGKVSIAGIGSTIITVKKTGDATYKDASASFTLIVAKKLQGSFVFPQITQERRLGDQTASLTASGGSGTGTISYRLEHAELASIDSETGIITPLKSGSTRVFATKAADETFEAAETEYSLIIKKQIQTPLSFQLNHVEKIIDAGSFLNALTGGSGTGELTYSTNNPAVATINEKTGEVSVLSNGDANLTVVKKGDDNFEEAIASFTLTVVKKTQSKLEFTTNYLEVYIGSNSYKNPLTGGSGNGLVTYSSSDEKVAIVDKFTGQLTLITEGKASISATKEGDNNFQAATATYSLDVTIIVDELIADVGLYETLVSWKKQSHPVSYFRTLDLPCAQNNIYTCYYGKETYIPAQEALPVKDNSISILSPGYISIGNNNTVSTFQFLNKKSSVFSKRTDPEVIAFNNKLFVIGGVQNGDTTLCNNEIWTSNDGLSWTQAKKNAAFSPRYNHQIVEFNQSLWLFGGSECQGTNGAYRYRDDLWRSEDGINWTPINIIDPVSARTQHSFTVFQNKLWLYGGVYGNSEIWSSADGFRWEKVVANAPFEFRTGQQMVAFNDKLWLIGGLRFGPGDFTIKNDIWSSSDGINWVKEKEFANFGPRFKHQVVAFNNSLYLIGGNSNNFGQLNEVWRSINGIDWTLINSPIVDSNLSSSQVVVFNNYIWLLENDSGSALWRSTDGINWYVPIKVPLEWQAR